MNDILFCLLVAVFAVAVVHTLYLRFRYHVLERKKHPNFREFLHSRALQYELDQGSKGRGRTNTVMKDPPWWRAPWLEFCLRLRVLRAATGSLLTMRGDVGGVGRLYAKRKAPDGTVVEDHGLISTKAVTDVGVAYIVDAFQNSVELENMKYHGIGTSGTAESQTDTVLGTEVESRATGTTTEGATANIYRTVGEVTTVSARAVVEHGIFSAASSGVLLDRSVFSVINTGAGDSIEFTYELTLTAGN